MSAHTQSQRIMPLADIVNVSLAKEGDLITMLAAQKEAFHEDEEEGIHLWHELVLWLTSFNIEFDKTCGAGK